MQSKTPLGVRVNNPLNLRPGSPWEGLDEPSEQDGFCRFRSPVWGFRAAFRVLITYADQYGLNTVRGIVSRWAPPEDHNDTQAYIAAVCRRTHFDPDQAIAVKQWSIAANLVRAMTIQECGDFAGYFTIEQMAEGAFRAGIADAPPPLVKRVTAVVSAAGASVSGAAAAASPIVQSYAPQVQAGHSEFLQIAFGVLAAGLAIVAAVFHARPTTRG